MAQNRMWLAEVLAAAEDAAPVASLDVVARSLRERFGAQCVSFLFADIVGRKMVRVGEDTDSQRGAVPIRFFWRAASTTRSCAARSRCRRWTAGEDTEWSPPSPTAVTPSVYWNCSCPM